jgi:hypothetical protein
MITRPGRGMENIVLGCSTEDVERVLGRPDSVTEYSDDIWWSFFDRGIDCCFGRNEKRLTAMNFFRDGVSKHKQAKVVTESNIGPGSQRPMILERFGQPSESGDRWQDRNGIWHRAWTSYYSGIAFEFGDDDKVDIMTVLAPRNQAGGRPKSCLLT